MSVHKISFFSYYYLTHVIHVSIIYIYFRLLTSWGESLTLLDIAGYNEIIPIIRTNQSNVIGEFLRPTPTAGIGRQCLTTTTGYRFDDRYESSIIGTNRHTRTGDTSTRMSLL